MRATMWQAVVEQMVIQVVLVVVELVEHIIKLVEQETLPLSHLLKEIMVEQVLQVLPLMVTQEEAVELWQLEEVQM